MENFKVTREEFAEYVRCQQVGLFNMLDYRSWSAYTFLSKDKWIYCISNYRDLKKAYA